VQDSGAGGTGSEVRPVHQLWRPRLQRAVRALQGGSGGTSPGLYQRSTLSVPTATLQAARLCQECAEVGARPTHWWCPVLLNALCKSLTCKFSISIAISLARGSAPTLAATSEVTTVLGRRAENTGAAVLSRFH